MLAVPAFAAGPAPAAALPAGCDTFHWDVAQELSLLQTPPAAVVAGTGGEATTRIEPGTFYRAALHPQAEVALAAPPGKPMLDDDAMAGLLTFRVPADGRYRVSITTGHWIDVVDDGAIVASLDFQGRRGCPLAHKIVEFELRDGRDLVLQFAGGDAPVSGVAVTAVPAPAR
ncbi:hypothetical protein WQ56_09490 [Luteimonas sp. FCS-9]|nr:hypothetical protein WQ56_09490 [Luteimonas sp. FCS-9]